MDSQNNCFPVVICCRDSALKPRLPILEIVSDNNTLEISKSSLSLPMRSASPKPFCIELSSSSRLHAIQIAPQKNGASNDVLVRNKNSTALRWKGFTSFKCILRCLISIVVVYPTITKVYRSCYKQYISGKVVWRSKTA